jgi:hypothetical protein
MAKLLLILIVAGALSEGLTPPEPPLLIDAAPSAQSLIVPLDLTE